MRRDSHPRLALDVLLALVDVAVVRAVHNLHVDALVGAVFNVGGDHDLRLGQRDSAATNNVLTSVSDIA